MNKIYLNRDIARLILLQRIELLGPIQKKIRKLLGRYFFTNFAAKYFIFSSVIGKKYLSSMENEYEILSKYLNFDNKTILSIGSGMCGLELVINQKAKNNLFYIIEKNYVSKKVTYGWDNDNNEAYNNLSLLNLFLIKNGMKEKAFKIYDFDLDLLPVVKCDIIISLFSLDYHYDFNQYYNYFKKIFNKKTQIIFDTIRPNYFKNIFENVKILQDNQNTVHKSKRIICSELIKR
tara:strand:+ start:68 stop:769 length:702 start_codon:yes stop_codon:yes gene_type:complete